jgi:DNA mismatch repair protein MutS2
MNKQTLQKLEFDRILAMLAASAYSEPGRQRALRVKPSTRYDVIMQRLDETAEAMELLRFGEPGYLALVKPIEDHLARARIQSVLSPVELYDIYRLLTASRLAVKYIGDKAKRLRVLGQGLYINNELEKQLNQAVDEEGFIKDDATSTLKGIRNQINTNRLRIKDYLQEFIRSATNQKMLQEILITQRDGRYVVPVKQEYRSSIKGIVHDESASGATVFIEPLSVVDFNNRIRQLQMEEKREIERILINLSKAVSSCTEELAASLEILAIMDLIFARARLAYAMDAYRPEINSRGIISIEKGRHPLLGERAVPIDVELGQDYDILVITGPNTGGKTVVLKTVGLLTVMAMSGLFIPAREKSRIAIFNSIFVDIGDEQSIEQSLSTFSSHIKNVVNILNHVDDKSLVLMDELGAGTDPIEGAALARSILEDLRSCHARVVVTTHQSELKTFAYTNERVENACVEFNPETLMPTYKLTIGMPGQSNAFEIGSRLGLKAGLVERARELVPRQEQEMGNMISSLKESKHRFETFTQEVEALKRELYDQKESLARERAKFEQERDSILNKSRQETEQYIRRVKKEADEALQEFKQALKDRERPPRWHEIEKSRQKLKQLGNKNKPDVPEVAVSAKRELRPGDYVKLVDLGQSGYIINGPTPQGNYVIQVGIMKLTAHKDKLLLTESPEEHKISRDRISFLEKAKHISPEIDLRGCLAEDALLQVDKYLEDANLAGLNRVNIIHGKGTGALRKAIREYLKDHRYVKTFRDGLHDEGGFGVTVVELK